MTNARFLVASARRTPSSYYIYGPTVEINQKVAEAYCRRGSPARSWFWRAPIRWSSQTARSGISVPQRRVQRQSGFWIGWRCRWRCVRASLRRAVFRDDPGGRSRVCRSIPRLLLSDGRRWPKRWTKCCCARPNRDATTVLRPPHGAQAALSSSATMAPPMVLAPTLAQPSAMISAVLRPLASTFPTA